MDEEKVIEELCAGNIDALDHIYRAYAAQALKTAYLITSDRYIAEDVLQEAFIQCFKSIRTLKDKRAFKPWFYKILTRIAFREIKKAGRLLPIENIFEKAEDSYNDKYFEDYRYGELYKYIERLGIKHKTAVILYYYNDMSIKDIAAAMECREGTVKSRLNSARKQLKHMLEKEGYVYEL